MSGMDPGIWRVDEHGQREALATEHVENPERLREVLDQETDVDRNTGVPRHELVGDFMQVVTGSPVEAEKVRDLYDALEKGPGFDSELLDDAVRHAYTKNTADEVSES